MAAALCACGDSEDGTGEDPRENQGIEGGNIMSGEDCSAGMVESPAPSCTCPGGVAQRFCTDEGSWGECQCIERSECLDVVDFICPNDCPGDPAPRSVGPCVDDEPPNCVCPRERPDDGSSEPQDGDAGANDAGADGDGG